MLLDRSMRALYVRDLTNEEREVIKAGLRSSSAFTVRRCQILLMSNDEHLKPKEISQRLHWSDQCARDAIRAFTQEGLACIEEKSRARHSDQATFDARGRAWLKELIRQSPRSYGYESSLWTLDMLADLAYRAGYSARVVNAETISRALAREKISWKRAKKRINSPDEQYSGKKSVEPG